MAKIRKDEEYPEEEGFEEDEEEEEGFEEDEEEEEELKPLPKLPPRPLKPKAELPTFMKPVREQPKPKEVKKRFAAFVQQQAEGIVDIETNETMTVLEAIANILERLERIENSIGMLSG